jgi:hypothetical protein
MVWYLLSSYTTSALKPKLPKGTDHLTAKCEESVEGETSGKSCKIWCEKGQRKHSVYYCIERTENLDFV